MTLGAVVALLRILYRSAFSANYDTQALVDEGIEALSKAADGTSNRLYSTFVMK